MTMVTDERLTTFLHQLYQTDGTLPDYSFTVLLKIQARLRELGLSFLDVEIGVKGEQHSLMSGLVADLERYRRRWDDAYPLLPKRWKEFEALVFEKVDSSVKNWRPVVARMIGTSVDLLRHYEQQDNVPAEYFIRLLKVDLHISAGPCRLDKHARKMIRLMAVRGQVTEDIATSMSVLLGIEVTPALVRKVAGEAAVEEDTVVIHPATAKETLSSGEFRLMARTLYGEGRDASHRFVAAVGRYCNIPEQTLLDLLLGREVSLTKEESQIRRFYHEEVACRQNPAYAALLVKFASLDRPAKGGAVMPASAELQEIAVRWFGEDNYILCLAHFTGVSKAQLDRVFGRDQRSASVALVQFVRDIDSALRAEQEARAASAA